RRVQRLLWFAGMALLHPDNPPVPTAAHLRTGNFQNLRHSAAVLKKVVEHHLAAGAGNSVRFAGRQPDENCRKDRVAPMGNRLDVDYRTQSPFGHEVTRVVTERFAPLLPMDRHLPFDDNLRLGWNFQWNRFARYEVHWPAADATSNG